MENASHSTAHGASVPQHTEPKYQLKSHMRVDENNNVTGLDPVGNAVVGTYLKIQDGVVGTYKKVEGKFVDAFLEPVPEDEAK